MNDVKDNRIFNAIIQTDTDGFEIIMKAGKIGVNWDMCIVREHFSIMRCHKCCGFDHTKETCTKNITCGYCGESHSSMDCQATQMSCILVWMPMKKWAHRWMLNIIHGAENTNTDQENQKHRRKSWQRWKKIATNMWMVILQCPKFVGEH